MADERNKAIETALAALEKQFGKGSVIGWAPRRPSFPSRSSPPAPSPSTPRWCRRRSARPRLEVFGPESSGKTTITLQIIAEAQKAGGLAAFVDAEHALDPAYAKKLGVDIDNLLISQPDYGEQALEIVEALVRSGAIDVLVVDSVAALVPKAELDGEMGDSHMGLQARLMSQALRKLTGTVSKSRTCLIFINQIREKIGVMFGNPETTTGGKALKFYSSMRIDIRRIGASGGRCRRRLAHQGQDRQEQGRRSLPRRRFDILYGEGISREGDALDLAVVHGIVDKSGAWYSFQGERIGQGRENVRAYLKKTRKSSPASTASCATSSAFTLPRSPLKFHPSRPVQPSPPMKPSKRANNSQPVLTESAGRLLFRHLFVASPLADNRIAQRNHDPSRSGVQNLDKGNEERIQPSQQTEVAAKRAAGQISDTVAEVAPCQQEEGNPQQQKDAPHRLAQAKADNPHQQREDAPHQKHRSSGGRWRGLHPARADRPLQQCEPPPEHPVRTEGDHAKGIACLELQHSGNQLCQSAVGKGQRHHDRHRRGRQHPCVDRAQHDRCEAEPRKA